MIHKLWFYQVTCVESGESCTDATVSTIITSQDEKKVAKAICDDFNGNLVEDHQEDDLKLEDIEVKEGNMWVRSSEAGDLVYTYQISVVRLDVEVSFPMIHYHEDGVELTLK